MSVWTPNFDMSSIPDAVFRTEYSHRTSSKRKVFAGGVLWAEHNPNTSRCRCAACMETRNQRRIAALGKPKRKPGRPKRKSTPDPEIVAVNQDIVETTPHTVIRGVDR